MKHAELKELLDSLVDKYNRIDFIENDPILIPHQYSKKQDIEIAAFIAAIFSWGQRVTIINKSKEFLSYMDNDPYQFILHHKESDLKPFLNFKHRTFNDTDALYFMSFFKMHYSKYDSLEDAFRTLDTGQRIMDTGQKTLDTGHWTKDTGQKTKDMGQRKLDKGQKTLDTGQKTLDMGQRLVAFRNYFFSMEDYPERTKKHVSSPANNATCKRINMFLRWMVRKDKQGVDFGIWNSIKPSELICPIDVHVANTANQFGLLKQEKINWNTAVALTETLKSFDAKDPVKYDFALFGLGVSNH
jgi:uncharacterized protein (TIGR02757 family)